jgi:isoleucyl-tRNA synthetase
MHEILHALVRVIAPILAFTADEIWRAMPDRPEGSVFTSGFGSLDQAWDDAELRARWERIWEIRGAVTRSLEEKRKAGTIGHSLDARVRLGAPAEDLAVLESLGGDAMAAICIVSQFEFAASDTLDVEVAEPRGEKCGRCWNFSEAVGTHSDYPDACDRCHAVVAAVS